MPDFKNHNHSLIQLFIFAAFALLMACTPEENNPGGNDNPGDKTVHVTGISLDRTTASIKEGEYFTLVATVTPENASNKTIIWSCSSDAVATVDNNGKVTGVKAGSATITATAEDGGMKATCALSVEASLAPSVTVEANHISAISAVLAGKANLGSTVASDLKVGFQYSKSAGILPSNSTTVEATDADENYNYTTSITGLEPDTKYYFRSFVRQNGQDTYGETKSFNTKDVASMLETKDASDIEATKATLNAKLDLTDVQYKSLDYGFLWGSSESALNTDFKCTEINDNAIAATLISLSHQTQYWYKAYVKLDSQTFCGEVKIFTTDDVVHVQSVALDKTENTFNTIGNILTLKATVLPSDATDKSVEWSSDKEDVATVDASGKVTAKGNGTATITVTTKDQGKTATCAITVAQWVTSITLSKTSLSLVIGEEETISVTSVLPDNANDKTYTWYSSDNSIAVVDQNGKITAKAKGNTVIKATANDGSGVSASCAVGVKEPYSAVAGEAVDLGLSVKWSSMNLGATSSTEYGDYFAWGETAPKDNYSWSTYELCNVSSSTLTRYNNSSSCGNVDNKTEFKDYDYEDDAARQALGVKWRMPTDEEWTELRTKCTWTWVTDYNGTGINGRLVTATNGNSIFLPAAGIRYDATLYYAGSYGGYWSSSLYTDSPFSAWYVYFNFGDVNRYYYKYRYYGFSVRPVTE